VDYGSGLCTVCKAAKSAAYRKTLKGQESHYKTVRTVSVRYTALLERARELSARGLLGAPLTLEQYRAKLFYRNGRKRFCHYCHHETGETGSGLDRKRNDTNYTQF
jgi:hypothetical protein